MIQFAPELPHSIAGRYLICTRIGGETRIYDRRHYRFRESASRYCVFHTKEEALDAMEWVPTIMNSDKPVFVYEF